LEIKLADPSLYLDELESQKTQASYQQIQASLDTVNANWEKLVDQISLVQQLLT
jgi:ATP-binding cassette, subfamily F, member 3